MEEAKRVVKQYTPYAYTIAFRLTGDQSAAWDLTQNAMLRVLKSFHTYDPSYSVEQWLHRIIRNLFIDCKRLEKRRMEAPLELPVEEDRLSPAETLVDPSPTPEKNLETQSRRTAVQDALSALPVETRMAVAMVDLEGYSYEDAAQILEIPISTLGVRVFRGRKLLRDRLKPLLEA